MLKNLYMHCRPGYTLIFVILFCCTITLVSAQVRIVSLGMYTGLTSTYTWDEGIYADPRYKVRYNLKFSAIGVNYGVDYEGFGFVISPGLFTTGQDYFMVNTVGGHEGTRKIDLHYLNIPFCLKFHVIDLDFLKTSLVMGAGPAFLINGKERISHNAGKFYFPPVVYPNLPENYSVEYDGVLAPAINELDILTKKDFDPLQIFATLGVRSDWYFSEQWKASFDFRGYYTFYDNRSDAYVQKLDAYRTLYDIPGKRRDVVAAFTIGISRYIEMDVTDKNRKVHIKSNTRKHVPPKRIERPTKKKTKLMN